MDLNPQEATGEFCKNGPGNSAATKCQKATEYRACCESAVNYDKGCTDWHSPRHDRKENEPE